MRLFSTCTMITGALLVPGQSQTEIKINRNLQPRHPYNRNARLHRFARDWLNYNLPNEKIRSRIRERIERWGVRLQEAYNRETCGFFDPTNPNSGDPNPNLNRKNGKSRRIRQRRDDESDMSEEDYNDWMNQFEMGGYEIMGMEDGDVTLMRGRKDMILNNPEKAIKNIIRGFKNFAKRYVAGCHGERENQIHSKRAHRMTARLLELYRDNLTKNEPTQ